MKALHTQPSNNPENRDETVDLMEYGLKLWNGRKTIFISMIAGAIIGIFIAVFSTKEYTATTVIVPQLSYNTNSGISGLASLAGINISTDNSVELSPLLYPQIVNSTPFKMELMNEPLLFNGTNKPVSFLDYYEQYNKPTVLDIIKRYTIGLPSVIIRGISNIFRGKTEKSEILHTVSGDTTKTNYPILLSDKEKNVRDALSNIIYLEVNSAEGYLTLSVRMKEAMAAAQLAEKAQALLQREIIAFKIEKANADLEFIQGRYDAAKTEFEKIQVSLAMNTDRNKNFTSGLSQIETERIQTRYNIAYSIFQELAKQLEQAKIQVKKETPVFTVIEPVSIPEGRVNPTRKLIMIIWIFLGGLIGSGIILGKDFVIEIKQKWNA